MRITVCGSSSFREKMVEFRDKLNELGHEAIIHPAYDEWHREKLPNGRERMKT